MKAPIAKEKPTLDVTSAAPDSKKPDAEREEFAVAEQHDAVERPPYDEAASTHQDRHGEHAQQEVAPSGLATRIGEHRKQQHERQDAQILKEQDRHGETAVR